MTVFIGHETSIVTNDNLMSLTYFPFRFLNLTKDYFLGQYRENFLLAFFKAIKQVW